LLELPGLIIPGIVVCKSNIKSYLFCLFRTTKYIHILTDEISVENKQARHVSQSDTCPPRFDIELNLIILKCTNDDRN
jgi:hypothetical protein